ncbi:MAG TPA: choline/ethanolamine kinase family protein [Steroidobacteraceae bacterium]
MAEGLSKPDTRELTLAEALAHVPGYSAGAAGVTIERLAGGSVNRSLRVCTGAGCFVVRLSAQSDAWLTPDRSAERVLQTTAAQAGIAPRILHADARDRWLITEFVAGRLWNEADFACASQLARLGSTLRQLHRLPAPAVGRFELLAVLRRYVQRIAPVATEDLTLCLGKAQRAWEVSGANGRAPAILHHDLHASNIIDESEATPVLIDWECAAVSDPLLDVACILSYYESARPHSRLLLQHSGLADVTPPQLAAALWLFDLHTLLWYRERRLRLPATAAELEAERRLAVRVAVEGAC